MVFADSICCCLLDGDVVTMVVAAVVVSYAAVEGYSMDAAFLLLFVVVHQIVHYTVWWNKGMNEIYTFTHVCPLIRCLQHLFP
jgi:hypothetical protein